MGSNLSDLKFHKSQNSRRVTIAVWLAVVLLVLLGLSRLNLSVWASQEHRQALIYLLLLFAVVSPLFFAGNLFKNLRHIILWAVALVILAYGYTVWRADRVGIRDFGGALAPQHDSASLTGKAQFFKSTSGDFIITGFINDVEVVFLLDTGATDVVLTQRDAERIGMIPSDMIFSRLRLNHYNYIYISNYNVFFYLKIENRG